LNQDRLTLLEKKKENLSKEIVNLQRKISNQIHTLENLKFHEIKEVQEKEINSIADSLK
jgi:hypothetical protein